MLHRPVFFENKVDVGDSPNLPYYDEILIKCKPEEVFETSSGKCYPKEAWKAKKEQEIVCIEGGGKFDFETDSCEAQEKSLGPSTIDVDLGKWKGIRFPRRTGPTKQEEDLAKGQEVSFVNQCAMQGKFTFPGVDRCLTEQELRDLLLKQKDCLVTPGAEFDPQTMLCKAPEAPKPELCPDGKPADPKTGCQRTEENEEKTEEKKSSTGMIVAGVGLLALVGGGIWWMSKNKSSETGLDGDRKYLACGRKKE